MFKKIKFKVAEGRCVMGYECKNVTAQEAKRLLDDPNVIQITLIRMTDSEYLKTVKPVNV